MTTPFTQHNYNIQDFIEVHSSCSTKVFILENGEIVEQRLDDPDWVGPTELEQARKEARAKRRKPQTT